MGDKDMQLVARFAFGAILLALVGSAPALAADCASLSSLGLPNTKVTTARLVPAGEFEPPKSPFGRAPGVPPASFKGMPEFCRIAATLTPTSDSDIKVEIWMPTPDNWNGKLVGIGNGVWAGSISYTQMEGPLSRGYAVVATDTGHVGNGMDAGFTVGHPEKLIDFGYRAVHEMTVSAKAFISAFYSKGPRLSFWTSCSTGGRQGLMEAYRYPEDYDGISAMAPANPMTNLMTQSIWTGYAALKNPESKLTPPKLMALHKAYLNACDAKDGVKDGFVSDPEHCSFDPKVAECKGKDGPDCLTAAQVETMREVYRGVVNPRTDKLVFPGFMPGSELQVGMLMSGPIPFPVATTYMSDIVFKDPKWDFKTFDYDKDVAKARKAGAGILDIPTGGLTTFFADGHKLLLSHGWSDGLIPAKNTVAFYKALEKKIDPKAAAEQVRLFMIPGMGHCGGGDGPFVWDPLTVIESWVETGKAPERITVSQPPNKPAMTRPLCPYPQVAKYTGKGSTDDAANFVCGKS
jgi:hypothetical protein